MRGNHAGRGNTRVNAPLAAHAKSRAIVSFVVIELQNRSSRLTFRVSSLRGLDARGVAGNDVYTNVVANAVGLLSLTRVRRWYLAA
jgi:hypothetical protein